MPLLVVNAGSSSLKVSVIGDDDQTLEAQELGSPTENSTQKALSAFLARAPRVAAVGHRIVHGGPDLLRPTIVDETVRRALSRAAEIAPLHDPAALHMLDVVRGSLDVPNVACFDTTFHVAMPEHVKTYALPLEWREQYGVRRYGFHGLSYAWALRRAAQLLQRPIDSLQLIAAHIGSGVSACAIRDGHSVDTTMGFTPFEGMVMATRSGSIDPGALFWLETQQGIRAADMAEAMEHQSGLLGLSGTNDLREVFARADSGDQQACLARDVYVHSLATHISAMSASLDRIDAVIFTGGAGEHSAPLRRMVCAKLKLIGVETRLSDYHREEDGIISAHEARVAVLKIHAREDLEIARAVRQTLAAT